MTMLLFLIIFDTVDNNLHAKSKSFKSLNAFKKFLGVCDLSNFFVYK